MTDTGFSGGKTLLAKQASEIISQDTTAVDLVSQLDVRVYRQDDPYQNHASAPFDPTFRAVLLKKLKSWTDAQLVEQLTNNDIATTLGFDVAEIPNRSTFYRAETRRFEALETQLETSVQQIETIAAERGSPVGANLVPEDSDGSSQRTLRRVLRRKIREVMDELKDVVFPALNLPRPEHAIYEKDELLFVESLLSVRQNAANNGAEIFSDVVDSEAELDGDDPFHLDGPTGETLLESIKELVPAMVSRMVNRAAFRCLNRAKPYLEFERPVKLALDITYVPFYGDLEEMPRVLGAPDNKEYENCHQYATASIVGDNVKFTVAMFPVGDPDHHEPHAYPGQDRSFRYGYIVRKLLDRASDVVSVRQVVADKAFFGTDIFTALEERDILYTIPAPKNKRIKRILDDAGDQVYVEKEHAVYGPVMNEVTNASVETNIVVLPPDEDHDSHQPFATNSEVDDALPVDRRVARQKIERYTERGAIETSYEKIGGSAPWTTSREYVVRLFHFGFATLVRNLWLLVDLMVQSTLDLEFRSKPRVTADRFHKAFEQWMERNLSI